MTPDWIPLASPSGVAVLMPLHISCGIFFTIGQLPAGLRFLVQLTPLRTASPGRFVAPTLLGIRTTLPSRVVA